MAGRRTVDVMGGALFGRDQLAVAAADGRAAYYYGQNNSHGAAAGPHHHRFVQSVGAGGSRVVTGGGGEVGAQGAGVVAAAGGGMAPASLGYGGAAPTQHPPPVAADHGVAAAPPFKGAWTKEEDEILKQLVGVHGDRKWAAIARDLPGRIGKQCRERWINHLHPGIKKDGWTEAEDMALIRAHRSSGNRWSVIARHLPGRSENSVKNHWNATKRSLAAKRRMRKRNSEQPTAAAAAAEGGQLSLLAEYIRSLCPDAATAAVDPEAPPQPPTTPSDDYVDVQVQAPPAQDEEEGGYENPPPPAISTGRAQGIYLGQAPAAIAGQYGGVYGGGVTDGRYSYYLPSSYPQMNLLHYGAPSLQILGGGNHFHRAVVDGALNSYLQQQQRFVVGREQMDLASNAGQEIEFDDRESSTNNNNQGAGCYYAEAAAGPSSGGAGGNYAEVVQMDSKELVGRGQDGRLAVDLNRFT